MIQQRREKWAEALTSGIYQQTTGTLYAAGRGYCCLGVAVDVYAMDHNLDPWQQDWIDEGFIFGESCPYDNLLPQEIRDYFGLTESEETMLADLNDHGRDFSNIAQIILEITVRDNLK